jgi:Zn-dependent protease
MNLETAIFLLPGLVIGLSLHEFAHAWSASLLGDDFARRQGRVSLNPLRHLSILGTLAIFFLPMGWGKPVEVNLYNFKHPRRDYLITSLAGPLANIIIVACCIVLAQLTRHDYSYGAAAQQYVSLGHGLLMSIAMINAILATLNLLPIPPLDGSKIWPVLIPGLKPSFGGKGMWICLILIVFLLRGGYLDPVFDFAFNSTDHYMPAKDSELYRDSQEMGQAAYDKNQFELAEKCFSNAIELNPSPNDALYWRAAARMDLGRLPEALADIDSAIEINSDPDYSEFRALILDKLKQSAVTPASQPTSRPASSE